jgi:acyl-coenzyme A thioesterase 13
MVNPVVEHMQAYIGKKYDQTPSGLAIWLNGTLLAVAEGDIKGEYEVRTDMSNPVGGLHGGASAAIIDDIIGACVFTLNRNHFYTTIDLNVNFMSPAKVGDTVIAHARIVRPGRTLIHAVCDIYNSQGKLLVSGSSNLISTEGK